MKRWIALLTAALAACTAPQTLQEATPTATVRVGLERVAAGKISSLQGKRAGLVVHAASVTADGRHAIDALRDAGVDVVRLFTPEHGLRSRTAAGEHVESGVDPQSGLPVVSLYGEHRKPTPEDLEELDVLVFDLQGAGVRFYTYVSTMILTLEAAAEAGLPFVVLDRPNPLGGERIEGPMSAPRDVVPESFVNTAPGPLVHGLTMGEMARLVNDTLTPKANLDVVPMEGWERSMVWADTGLPWVAPSPNLVSPEAALLYPGTAFFESTNVSEGRGTETPFLFFGAPWLDTNAISVKAPGVLLTPITFTPKPSEAAPNPKYVDEICHGFRAAVTDARKASPYQLGVQLLKAFSEVHGFEWRNDGEALTWLVGTPDLHAQIEAGASVTEIIAADAEDHAAWREARKPFLLYD